MAYFCFRLFVAVVLFLGLFFFKNGDLGIIVTSEFKTIGLIKISAFNK